ncbi:MAG: hypothetical protein ACK56F_24085, partial [bacterium]
MAHAGRPVTATGRASAVKNAAGSRRSPAAASRRCSRAGQTSRTSASRAASAPWRASRAGAIAASRT